MINFEFTNNIEEFKWPFKIGETFVRHPTGEMIEIVQGVACWSRIRNRSQISLEYLSFFAKPSQYCYGSSANDYKSYFQGHSADVSHVKWLNPEMPESQYSKYQLIDIFSYDWSLQPRYLRGDETQPAIKNKLICSSNWISMSEYRSLFANCPVEQIPIRLTIEKLWRRQHYYKTIVSKRSKNEV